MKLRSYQQSAVDAIFDSIRNRDDNPVAVLPTGAGKSVVLAKIASDAVDKWKGRVLVLAHVKELLEQNADKVRRLCPGIPVGIYSAGLKKRDTNTPVLVAGIQSIYKRACELNPFDLIVVDEAHLISKSGDGMYRQFLADCKVINPHVRVIGLTATPFRLDSGMICAADHFLNHICYEIGIKELIRDEYLCPLISKAGVNRADFGDLHVRAGEFVSDEVESLVSDPDLVTAACAELIDLTQDRKAVLIFA
ncbi:MAG: DEAD/DEAH box helicase family protein, partial [Gammaproteobacteria bacterium]|nr:DEAD/DEAH box helicase family protein [Gammaproteobacteria bacterium]